MCAERRCPQVLHFPSLGKGLGMNEVQGHGAPGAFELPEHVDVMRQEDGKEKASRGECGENGESKRENQGEEEGGQVSI